MPASPDPAAEFVAAPVPDRGRPWNLVAGEVVVNEPSYDHSWAQDTIHFALQLWTRAAPGRGVAGSAIDIGLDDQNVFAPDVRWYRDGRAPGRQDQPPYPMPDLVVEVRSPSTWRYDTGTKRDGYERHGLPELWLVDTVECTVIVYRRSSADVRRFDITDELTDADVLVSPSLPGFALPVGDVFAAP